MNKQERIELDKELSKMSLKSIEALLDKEKAKGSVVALWTVILLAPMRLSKKLISFS